MIETAVQFLLQAQNPDGGWGVEKGRRSNTEATSLSVLGLSAVGDQSLVERINPGLHWLTNRQNANGSWPLTGQLQEGSWASALAILPLAASERHRQGAVRGAKWLLRQEGRDLGWAASLIYRLAPEKLAVQLNPDLKGWSWTSGTFSWVEPTAYALIAIKKLRPYLQGTYAEERIRQGELMIYDRICEGGGWNHGNAKVLGENMWPYPDMTALALIALQDHRAADANQLSLHALRKMLTHVQSGLSVSWSIICFSLYGYDVSRWRELLARNYEKTGFLGETKTVALALLASGDGPKAFRV
ncbi:MAG: prenyltransferase/squalene oxidase repeat-containing protein [Candidatus Binatia bacterium]